MSERLLEREDEIRALHDAVEAASRGEGRLVLLAGDAGAGKTSLVRELVAEVARVGLPSLDAAPRMKRSSSTTAAGRRT